MGLGKMLRKTLPKIKHEKVFIAEAVFENWEEKGEEEPKKFLDEFIAKVKQDYPLYRYVKSTFDYTHDGNINFRARFELKEFRSSLTISHRRK